jgi:hypothetical protein
MADDNKAPFVSSDAARASYHCPRTTCNGHFYLASKDMGRVCVCDKCGLEVTIGHLERLPRAYIASMLIALLVGLLAGILVR